MPKLRRFGGTKIPAADENTTFPCRLISPDFGTSRPAMERSVVVFPQPLGPSSVKSFPSGTSNETSWVARTASPRSLGYSVHSDLTISTISDSGVRDAEPPGGKSFQQDEAQQRRDQHHAQRRKLHILTILPIFPDHDRQHFRSRAVEQNGAGKLAYGDDHHVDPAGNQAGLEQRQHHPPERHAPRRAAHHRGLLQLLVQRQH